MRLFPFVFCWVPRPVLRPALESYQRSVLSPQNRPNSLRIRRNSTLLRTGHQTTDKCRRDRHRKLIRFSAPAPRPENSYVFAESRPQLRLLTKRSEIDGRIRTICGSPSAPPLLMSLDRIGPSAAGG